MKKLGILIGLALVSLGFARADYTINGVSVSSSSTITLGVWNSNTQTAVAYAQETGIPLVLLRAKSECSQCAKLETSLASDEFLAWAEERRLVMCFSMNTDNYEDWLAAYNLTPTTLIDSSSMPKLAVYWWKQDGTTVSDGWVARTGKMGQSSSLELYEQFINAVESVIADYVSTPSYTGGYFAITNLPNSRLEVLVGTAETSVNVPLYRETTGVCTNTLTAGSATQTVVWSGSETSKIVPVAVTPTTAGTAIALTLKDADGETVSTSAINVVEDPGNSVKNPYWVGEKTAETLNYGEWTLDYDTALEKIKNDGGYILANFSGVLWCPYCNGIETSLLADSAFTSWAEENKVVLVLFDQARSGLTVPRLLSYDEGTGLNSTIASGAAYLSRKGIDLADAQTVIDATTEKSTSTWLAPDTTAARIGNPTFLLINSDETVAARARFYRTDDRAYPTEENLNRLNDLLLLAGSTEANNYKSTTALTYAIGSTATGTLQVNDNVDYYKLETLPSGEIKFTATTDSGVELTVGEIETTDAGDSYVSVSAYTNALATVGADSTISYTLESTVVLVPEEAASSYTAVKDTVTLRLVSGTLYNITGLSSGVLSAALTASGDYWTATVSGDVEFAVTSGTEITYQIWNPGTVAFDSASQTVLELAGSGTVSVTRSGGSSGETTVSVDIAKNLSVSGRLASPTGSTTLTWEDGESGTKVVSFTLTVDGDFQETDTFVLSLSAGSTCSATVSEGTHTVTVIDSTDPMLNSTSYSNRYYTNFETSESYPVNNILENGTVTLKKVSGKLPSGIRLKYDKSTKSVVVSGKPTKTGTYTYSFTISERRSDGKATGLETTFTFTVVDPSALDETDEDYNPFVCTALSAVVPLFGTSGDDTLLAGTLTLSVTAKNKISAKFKGEGSRTTAFSGYWQSLASGTASATLTKSGKTLELSLGSDGCLAAAVSGVTSSFGETLATAADGFQLVAEPDYTPYAGTYTVTLPLETDNLAAGGETRPTGTGYLTLKMTSSSFKRKGTVTYSGKLADGTSVSGSATLQTAVHSDGSAQLAVFKSTSKYTFGVVLKILPDAASIYESNPMIILADDGATSYWSHKTYGFGTIDVYGGYYSKDIDLYLCATEYYETETFDFTADTTYFAESERYGSLAQVAGGTVTVGSSSLKLTPTDDLRMTLSYSRSTGVVRGRLPIVFSNGKTVRASYYGVLLPYWNDCGCFEGVEAIITRPFFSGFATYTDRVNGKSVKRGFAVNFEIPVQ